MHKNKIKEKSILLILIISLGIFVSCKKFNKMNDVRYGVNATCAEGYGIDLYTGVFKSPKGDIVPILSQNLNGYWGMGGNSDAVGDGFDPLPNRLRLGFYSYVEDKFYEGEFELPYEQLQEMFKEVDEDPFYKDKTFDDTQSGKTLKYMKYDALNVGITIGGNVSVWISGTVSRQQKEIAHFKLKEATQVKWEDIYPDRIITRSESRKEDLEIMFTPKILNEIKTKTLPFNLWNSYRKKYNWRYVFEFPDDGKLDEIYINYINAEADNIFSNNPRLNDDTYQMRALPYNLDVHLQNGNGEKYQAWIVSTESLKFLKQIYKGGEGDKYPDDFREEELYKIFQTLDENKPIDIIYKITPDYENINIFIKQGNKETPCNKVIQWLMKNDKK